MDLFLNINYIIASLLFTGSAKKRDVVRVTQVLTASKLSPRQPPNNQNVPAEGNSLKIIDI